MRHLHAGKINYNATSMINEDMMMVMNAQSCRRLAFITFMLTNSCYI